MITDLQACNFLQLQRDDAQLLYTLLIRLEGRRAEWTAKALGDTIPNTSEVFDDGSELNGNEPAAGSDSWLMVSRYDALIAEMRQAFWMDVINKIRPGGG